MESAVTNEIPSVNTVPISQDPNRPIRVLYFDHTAMLGGGEIALLNLIRYVDRRHVTPIVVLCAEGPLADRLRKICEVHVLPLPDRVRNTRKDGLGWKSVLKLHEIASAVSCSIRLARFALKNDVDLIHTNSLKADIIGGIASRLARRPVVWHVRDRIEVDYLPKSVVRAFRLLCGFLPTYVIANSQAVLETLHLRRSGGSVPSGAKSSQRFRVVHEATIVPSDPAPITSGSESPLVGLVGRICPWKGQHIFLQVAATVHRRFPGARFRIVGAALFGEEQHEVRIRRLCSDLGLESVVEFTGFRPDVGDVIAELDVLVHASTTGEPFGQVIIEGMAAAKPVVATNGGGVPEIVVDSVTGFLVPMGDVSAMAEAVCKVLADPLMARRMGLQGFGRVRQFFTIEGAARKVESVYRTILGTSHSTGSSARLPIKERV
jgi:glycosyltransferase involved in cell wall biosynthesis